MPRKVFRTGNSVVVSLPPDALEFLGLYEGADVSVELDRENRCIVITPLRNTLALVGVDEEFNQQLQSFIDLYRPALEELSK
jgi:antitoxin component of MazEF toxin-antitoxin module